MEDNVRHFDRKPRVFMVDDQPYYHALVEKSLGDVCTLVSLGDGETALMEAAVSLPDLILLDVEMPGMGGYETCRRFKSMGETADVPILFLSAHDEIDDRMKGYEAGGQDYITKPFDWHELKAKVLYLLGQVRLQAELRSMVDSVSGVATAVMSSVGELGVLRQSLKRFHDCADYADLAKCVVSGMADYGLHGVVQMRAPGEVLTFSRNGPGSPLEESIIARMSQMECIVAFQSRLSITYKCITLLINDMPVNDTERNARLRDDLTMLVEAANARAEGIIAIEESRLQKEVIEQTVNNLADVVGALDLGEKNRFEMSVAASKLTENVEHALLKFGLTDTQEQHLLAVVREGVENIIQLNSEETNAQASLLAISESLNAQLKKPWEL